MRINRVTLLSAGQPPPALLPIKPLYVYELARKMIMHVAPIGLFSTLCGA